MSDVKICNRHGGMFAAKEVGSALLQGTIYRSPTEDGISEEHIKWDLCAKCVVAMQQITRVDYKAIARMEEENGITIPEGTTE